MQARIDLRMPLSFCDVSKDGPWISVSIDVINYFPLTVLLLHTYSTIHVC